MLAYDVPMVTASYNMPARICRLFVVRLIRDLCISTERNKSLSPLYTSVNLADDDPLDLRFVSGTSRFGTPEAKYPVEDHRTKDTPRAPFI